MKGLGFLTLVKEMWERERERERERETVRANADNGSFGVIGVQGSWVCSFFRVYRQQNELHVCASTQRLHPN